MWKIYKLISWLYPIRDWLYILQLEEYELPRYLKQIKLRLGKRDFEKRDKLKFTTRVKLIFLGTNSLVLLLFFLVWQVQPLATLVLLLLLPFLTPGLIVFSSLIVTPLVKTIRRRTIQKAKLFFIKQYPQTKVIAITGSYGKTTTKYLLHDLLHHTFRTDLVPENINTTLGVANYLLSGKIAKQTEYLIVEMGAYVLGDIAECCQMLPPDVSLITKLGDQHLERFGNFDNLVKAKYEIFAEAKPNCKKYTTEEALSYIKKVDLSTENISAVSTEQTESGNKVLASRIAKDLGVNENFITSALNDFKPPERRNKIDTDRGVTILDNSYNISPQTAEKMLQEARVYADQVSRRLVVMSGGIEEQGEKNNEINIKFGSLLNHYADRVILHPTIYLSAIQKNLTVPAEIVEVNKTVTSDLPKYLNGEKEVLLYLTGLTDLSYV